jgi:hypothetical protein
MKIVTNDTITLVLQSDLPENETQTHPSGIIHSNSNGVIRDTFLWVSDLTFIQSATNHLIEQGYTDQDLVFIPFSSKENWIKSYPFLTPSLECDDNGTVGAFQPPTPPKRKRGGTRMHKSVVLTNDLRDELHIQIYRYFHWLLPLVSDNQSTHYGRRLLQESGLSILGVQSMLSTIESIFPMVKSLPSNDDDVSPILEHKIEDELGMLADQRLQKTQPDAYQSYDYDEMFEKLKEFKQQNGHCKVPHRYKEDTRLAKWVNKIREKKTALGKKGVDYEIPKPKRKLTSCILTKERVDQLNEIGFVWRVNLKPSVSWDTRYHELIEYYQTNGSWPPKKKGGSLGAWAHNQRNLYSRKDKHFMLEKASKLDAIGERIVPYIS